MKKFTKKLYAKKRCNIIFDMDNSEILAKAKEILGRDLTCIVPFEHLDFSCDGSVFPCCPALIDKYSFGDIFKDKSVDKIWNGEKAQEFRRSILDGSFRYCRLDSCLNLSNIKYDDRYNKDLSNKSLISDLPKEIYFHIDSACNVRCITCRDEKVFMTEFANQYEKILDSVMVPFAKNARTVYFNGAGEIFASKLCKNLIQKLTEAYPDLKFNLITNGILATKENIERYGLKNKILSIEVSMHAVTKETYDKIVRGGDFDAVMKNLETLSEMKKNGEIKYLWLNYVVTSYNYKEMIDFQKLANKLGAYTRFWEYRKWGTAELDNRYDEVAIFEPTHPDYDKYLEVVKDKIFDEENCCINYKLRPFN